MAKTYTHGQRVFNYRLLTFVLACFFGIIFSIPSFFQDSEQYPFFNDKPKITLGLDLQGGLSLLLHVDVKAALESRFSAILGEIKYQTDKNNIFISRLRIKDNTIFFTLLDSKGEKKIYDILANIPGAQSVKNGQDFTITIDEMEQRNVEKDALEQAINTIRNRLDKFGLTEPNVSREGINQIRVEMPGVKTQEEQQRLINLISQNAKLEFMPYIEDPSGIARLPVKSIPILDGSSISDARTTLENGLPAVSFKLDSKGAAIFGDFTGRNINKQLAIVLDKKIVSAPRINTRIGGGNGVITGNFNDNSAKDLSITLRSGALLAPVDIIEKRSVGPSLGADSIRASLIALVSGFILVVGFMILYYSIAGIFASLALIVNLFLIIAVMALFGATLTLPGMAGIVLTVGMAVDANIIINDDVWIGCGVRIMAGVEIGSRVIVGAGAVVTSNLMDHALYAGVPAKYIKSIS